MPPRPRRTIEKLTDSKHKRANYLLAVVLVGHYGLRADGCVLLALYQLVGVYNHGACSASIAIITAGVRYLDEMLVPQKIVLSIEQWDTEATIVGVLAMG